MGFNYFGKPLEFLVNEKPVHLCFTRELYLELVLKRDQSEVPWMLGDIVPEEYRITQAYYAQIPDDQHSFDYDRVEKGQYHRCGFSDSEIGIGKQGLILHLEGEEKQFLHVRIGGYVGATMTVLSAIDALGVDVNRPADIAEAEGKKVNVYRNEEYVWGIELNSSSG